MIDDKNDCIDSIIQMLNRTAAWRKATAPKFPDDPRNMKAAHTLDKLALEAANLTDEQWTELKPHFSWASEKWRNGLSHTARQTGFMFRAGDLAYFIKALLQNLSPSSLAA